MEGHPRLLRDPSCTRPIAHKTVTVPTDRGEKHIEHIEGRDYYNFF